ncbi:chemotaxis protein CheW [Phenylobacterium sp.]|uniref:chemotaxis protein CheW n=1 Tax=Phenylobacterium sp. TaxID=1871053 RepID=UPI0035B27EB2
MDAGASLSAAPAELISVRIGEQLFALDIMAVREIRGWTVSTPLPHAPDYVLGMINLRGAVLPVVDLAGLLGLQKIQPDASSVVVVAEVGGRTMGLLVDAVCDIITVQDGELKPAPDLGSDDLGFVSGVITAADGIVTVLQLDGALPAVEEAA